MFLGWSRHDRDAALWWLIHDRQRCPSCGTRPDEWDPAKGGDLHAYAASAVHCRGCQVLAPAQEEFDKQQASYPRGTTIQLRPRS